MKYCADASITFRRHLYYTMFVGQVSSKEINHIQYKYPKIQAERDVFDFDAYRSAVNGLPQHNFPPFHQKDVRSFTRTMLLVTDSVRDSKDRD